MIWSRRATLAALAATCLAALLAACSVASKGTPESPGQSAVSLGPVGSSSLQPRPATGNLGSPEASVPLTTLADWGTIWDDLPPSFPRYPRSEPADTGAGAASATLTIPTTVKAAADWYRQALEAAGYDTEAVEGPLEDGGLVIESVGTVPDCRAQTSIVPEANQVIATILVAAACPFR